MAPVVYERERRSSRAFLRVTVVVKGKNRRGKRFHQTCESIVVNECGGLLCIPQELDLDTELIVTSPFIQGDQECRVVYLGEETSKGLRVGIEFLTPAPRFWGIEFLSPVTQPR